MPDWQPPGLWRLMIAVALTLAGCAGTGSSDPDQATQSADPHEIRIEPESEAALAIDALNREAWDEALVILEPMAANPDHPQYIAANRLLAMVYGRGMGVAQDQQRAIRHIESAANAGHALSQIELAKLYDRGQILPRDPARIFYWSQQAASQDLAEGQQYLGWCYHFGIGTKQDLYLAMTYYELAAQQGNALARNNLASMLLSGEAPTGPDNDRAITLLEEAAAANLPAAQLQLGILLANGELVEKDTQRALGLFETTAAAGSGVGAMLAGQLLESDGDAEKALDYYRRAQQLGVPSAQAQIDRLRGSAE